LLELPSGYNISPIFNVADLYDYPGHDDEAAITTPPIRRADQIEDILESKSLFGHEGVVEKVLVKWRNKPMTENTWITLMELQ
jgi:hypothetical protein